MKTNDYKLINIKKENISELAAVFTDVFTNEPWNYTWLSGENVRRYLGDLAATPKFLGFAYKSGNPAAGACFGIVNDYFSAPAYEIKEIYVARKTQRAGVGSAMLKLIEAELSKIGISAVTLFTQRKIPAYDFYIKNGYRVSDDAVYFSKML